MNHALEERLNEVARQRERQGWRRLEPSPISHVPAARPSPAASERLQGCVQKPEPRARLRLARPSKKNPRRWVHATGSPESLHAMAVFYLRNYKYEAARQMALLPEFTLAKVVCNLRHYYLQSREMTISLVLEHFNPRFWFPWCAEAIGLTWDLVEPYAPNMGLEDPTAVNRERAAELYDAVVDLVLMLEPGGRVLVSDLYQCFLALNPDIDPVPSETAFGIAVGDVTGKTSTPSRGKRYYSGFRLPSGLRVQAAA